jgi:peptidyl-tRNA hydrolase, PTH2 family
MPVEPNPFDNAKLAEIRAEQGDPIIQYYIVRTDVPMSIGKAGAQIAHAAQMFVFGYLNMKSRCDVQPQGGKPLVLTQITEEWMNGSFRKVFLGGKKKDFEKIKNTLDVFLVRDAGLTEVEPGTETVLVTWPMRKNQQPKLLARLRVLSSLMELPQIQGQDNER